MAPVKNGKVVFNSVPEGNIDEGLKKILLTLYSGFSLTRKDYRLRQIGDN